MVDGKIGKQYVDFPGSLSGNGLRVSLPNGTYFTYLHMSAFAEGMGVGVPVKAGQLIGYVGMTGNAATPHLHFEVHPSGGRRSEPLSPGRRPSTPAPTRRRGPEFEPAARRPPCSRQPTSCDIESTATVTARMRTVSLSSNTSTP